MMVLLKFMIHAQLKKQVGKILRLHGLNHSGAIRLFYQHVAEHKKLPSISEYYTQDTSMPEPFNSIKKRWLSGDRSDAKFVEENQEYAFSLALIEARLAAGLTQKQAAKRAGLSTSTVARYESGHIPVIRLYAAAADALDLKLKLELLPISTSPDRKDSL
uniref:HTH cro/C1-type domain-containing protein n=1 Tax=Magnetococcus massalia (strain MO-1) TaxID=451514 RepID=A0A1S7LJL7_MAGMO|nr:protein of unknown function [Including DNA binding Helix-turn-helix protein domain] [Candidatus Magnetococcus massalia]